MTLLQRLQAHRGELVRIKTEVFWYGGQGWDGSPGRVCLLLDVAAVHVAVATTATAAAVAGVDAAVHLLIDGAPHWIWVAAVDIELLT